MSDYAGVLADLKAKRDALEKERIALERAINSIEKLLHFTGGSNTKSLPVAFREFVGLTMPQAILTFLGRVNEPQSKNQIKTGVLAGGMKGGTNIGSHIYNTLHRLSKPNGPIIRDASGRWSLRPKG
jgi:hypothetical protein